MRSIANIFESIFNQDEKTIEAHASIADKNSPFWTDWASQFSGSQKMEFKANGSTLYINSSGLLAFRADLYHPVSNYIPNIQKTVLEKDTSLNLHGGVLDQSFLGKTIRVSNGIILIVDTMQVHNITFQLEKKSLTCNDCGGFINCKFENVDQLYMANDNYGYQLQDCYSDSVETIFFKGPKVFKSEWKELSDAIDWNAIDPPIDLQKSQPVSLSKKSIPRLASIVKYMSKYSWQGHCDLPLKISGDELIKKLFHGSSFPKLSNIYIKDRDVLLNINFKYGNTTSCSIQSKNFHGSRSGYTRR